MQTLKVSVSLPDATHSDMQLRLSANDSTCDVVISLPASADRSAPWTTVPRDAEAPDREHDDYVLGGYAGI
ncbi:hypothetical protein [Dyella koreensis]|uniref:Uncharacterized protein n=1 Tax=Dyella koreensis TaxID=311235 RepID=A0ABW8K4C5_9GAMM